MLTNTESASCPGCIGSFTGTGSFERGCLDNQCFPLHSQAIVCMQSPAMLSAVLDGISPTFNDAGATLTSEPFYQCGSVASHTVVDSSAPPVDITTKTKFWTLDSQVEQWRILFYSLKPLSI